MSIEPARIDSVIEETVPSGSLPESSVLAVFRRFFGLMSSGTGKVGASVIGDIGAGEDARAPGAPATGMASGALEIGSDMSW